MLKGNGYVPFERPGALAFKLEWLSEFVPKLAPQSIMVHFCIVCTPSIPLQEHSRMISQQEFSCIIVTISVRYVSRDSGLSKITSLTPVSGANSAH